MDREVRDHVLRRLIVLVHPRFLSTRERAFCAFALNGLIERKIQGKRLREAVCVVIWYESNDVVWSDLTPTPVLSFGDAFQAINLVVVEKL